MEQQRLGLQKPNIEENFPAKVREILHLTYLHTLVTVKERNKEAYNQLNCKFENTQVTTGYCNAQATQKPKPGHTITEK